MLIRLYCVPSLRFSFLFFFLCALLLRHLLSDHQRRPFTFFIFFFFPAGNPIGKEICYNSSTSRGTNSNTEWRTAKTGKWRNQTNGRKKSKLNGKLVNGSENGPLRKGQKHITIFLPISMLYDRILLLN